MFRKYIEYLRWASGRSANGSHAIFAVMSQGLFLALFCGAWVAVLIFGLPLYWMPFSSIVIPAPIHAIHLALFIWWALPPRR